MRADSTARRGPELPYSLVAGVTPCGPRWLVASAKLQGPIFAPENPQLLDTFVDVLDQRPSYAAIALNAPIGYLDLRSVGGRTCDREARTLLAHRGASIKSAPVRSPTNELEFLPEHLDAISMTLLPRYQEVATEMAPFRQRTVYEVRSDLTFFELNGGEPMQWSKDTEKGRHERIDLLQRTVPGIERVLEAEIPDVPQFHLIDVAAFLWTARRIFLRAAIRLPEDPEWDETGLRMELVR